MEQSGRQPEDEVLSDEDRVATAAIDVTQQQMQYLVVTEGWFSENVGKELVCVMDCFSGRKEYKYDNVYLLHQREAENVDVEVEQGDDFISLSFNDPIQNIDQGETGLLSSDGTDVLDATEDALQ